MKTILSFFSILMIMMSTTANAESTSYSASCVGEGCAADLVIGALSMAVSAADQNAYKGPAKSGAIVIRCRYKEANSLFPLPCGTVSVKSTSQSLPAVDMVARGEYLTIPGLPKDSVVDLKFNMPGLSQERLLTGVKSGEFREVEFALP